jgi:hypothetical protein
MSTGHYPCGSGAGQTLEIMPNVGWANAIPDAESIVEFTIQGSRFAFTGVGYHDKVSDYILSHLV